MAHIPRILFTAPASGKGKTLITCVILYCLKMHGLRVAAFKCGPDYIDPMFHREVLGTDSYNLDTFLCGREHVSKILAHHARQSDIAVLEGVMGYYDGIGGISADASAYDIADATDTPAVLIVDGKGAGLSVVPCIQGLLRYRDADAAGSHIGGVILNRVSGMQYLRLKELIEREALVKVYGYLPERKEFVLESRHLGLKLPGETGDFLERIKSLGERLEDTLDIEGMISLAKGAPQIEWQEGGLYGELYEGSPSGKKQRIRIGIAQDEAFCFIYKDNLELLSRMGAELAAFSPLHDTKLPEAIDGLILYGGYPENYAGQLSKNRRMSEAIREALKGGMPCIAECGGFMYLQEEIEGMDGVFYPAVGALRGRSRRTDSLRRFGYITLEGGKVFGQDVGKIPAHEFHYYDSDECGNAFVAKKPLSKRSWECMISTDTMLAGYPHIHYLGNCKVAEAFLKACKRRRDTDDVR